MSRLALLLLGFGGWLSASSAVAQESRDELVAACGAQAPAVLPLCLEGALTLEAARGGVGIAASQGSPLPGSASTLGRRLGASPRIALSIRPSVTRVTLPDPREGAVPMVRRSLWVPAVEGTLALGVLDGVSLLPTIGGLFSVDLTGSVGVARLSSGNGFDRSAQWFGYGARVGLLRESFTLPGVTVAVTRRKLTELEWGGSGDQVQLVFKPTITSIRAAIGKDLLAFGILGGWGWERYGGSGDLTVRPVVGADTHGAPVGRFNSDRTLIFGGLSYTFLVLQLAVEGGFSTGWDQAPGRDPSVYDPTGGTIFASVSGRLTL